MSGEPIPKRGYRSIEREALLDAPSVKSDSCLLCGCAAENDHHAVIKGMGGAPIEEGPTLSVCGVGNLDKCHRLLHGNGVKPRYSEKHSLWYFTATDEAAADINKRRRRSGLPRIKGGEHPCTYAHVAPPAETPLSHDAEIDNSPHEAVPADSPIPTETVPASSQYPTDAADALHSIAAQIAEASGIESSMAYLQGTLLRKARAIFAARYTGRREAQQAFGSWFVEALGMAKSAVSKLECYASLPESAANLGVSKGYLAARAVKDKLASVEDAIADASVLSVSDLKQRYWPREESEKVTIVCPLSGADCTSAAAIKNGGTA